MGSLRQLYWRQRMERREITTAARVIQNAYRVYKSKAQTRQRQLELECKAAVVIQTYYRRYKQYRYCKKLHQAAALIQRQFRLYKSTKRKGDQRSQAAQSESEHMGSSSHEQPLIQAFTDFLENEAKKDANLEDSQERSLSDDLCSPSCSADDEYWDARRQQAAMRIQQAFRGHRKRQAAAEIHAKKRRRCSTSNITIRPETLSPELHA